MRQRDFHKEIEIAEVCISNNDVKPEDIRQYNNVSLEMENFIAMQGEDKRNHIMLVIPVADRPQHLENCLQSIFKLCEYFYYGGKTEYFNKVSVLVAEDSNKVACRGKHKEIAESFTLRGLRTTYFGLDEQKKILAGLGSTTRKMLDGVVGDNSLDSFSHKGASITRNITYLKLNQLKNEFDNVIFYFIDSDQEFKVNPVMDDGGIIFYSLNYFHHLNRIFTDNDIEILTGKVVGDPPVSPSVMAANFLDDVCSFLLEISAYDLDGDCCFHGNRNHDKENDAAYHDMADLFGFKIKANTFNYCCELDLPHTNNDCLEQFASQLNSFFDGVHLTRKNYYQHKNISQSVVAARTVYTGNFAFSKNALKYFIPFANLKLRMAGPTMGRLIKDKLGSRFVSANLPMLHERTIKDIGKSEFRSGIQHAKESVSLQGEFERQYFGDVMLFSIEELIKSGYPEKNIARSEIKIIIEDKEEFLRESYSKKLQQVQDNIKRLKLICNNKADNNHSSMTYIVRFIDNMELNFSERSSAYQLVTSDNTKSLEIENIIDAIMNYKNELNVWERLLEQ